MIKNNFCIFIPQKIINDMFEYAEKGAPLEVCGILAGSRPSAGSGHSAGNGNKVKKIYKMANTDKSSVSYFMKPEEQFDVLRKIRLDKQDMLAIFHSHPASPPVPSKKDMDMAFYPECVYIIISLGRMSAPGGMFATGGKQEIKGFRMSEGEVKEIKIMALKKVLFVCTENACRSQMAEGWAKKLKENIEPFSCGSHPRGSVDEMAVKVMKEAGVDVSKQFSKGYEEVTEKEFDITISMGCKDRCPSFPTKKFIEWDIPDPRNKNIEFMRKIRDIIKQKVEKL